MRSPEGAKRIPGYACCVIARLQNCLADSGQISIAGCYSCHPSYVSFQYREELRSSRSNDNAQAIMEWIVIGLLAGYLRKVVNCAADFGKAFSIMEDGTGTVFDRPQSALKSLIIQMNDVYMSKIVLLVVMLYPILVI